MATVSKKLGKLLKSSRNALGLTQDQLVKYLWEQGIEKYSKADISKWEHGITKPPVDVIEALADVLLVQRAVLLEAAGHPPYSEEKVVIGNDISARFKLEHLQEVRQLLESWKRELETMLCLLPNHLGFDYEVQGERLFVGVLEHCPLVKERYEALRVERDKYERAREELKTKIIKESPLEATEYFTETASAYSILVAHGGSLPCYELDIQANRLCIADGSMQYGIAKGNEEALHRCEHIHRKLIGNYSSSQEVTELVRIRKTLSELERCLFEAVEICLLNREYGLGKCGFCPS